MISNWNPETYDAPRRRLVPCYPEFYGTAVDLISRTVGERPRIRDLGTGAGLLAAEVVALDGVDETNSSPMMLSRHQ